MTRRDLLNAALGLALTGLASCGDGSPPGNSTGRVHMEQTALATLDFASDAFRNGQPIPTQYSCDGASAAPALRWSDPPAGTKGFALVVDDPDAPHGTFRHWGVFDIPASARSLGGGRRIGTEVTNDFGKPGYGGPCPPKGQGPHHYHFKLFALDVEKLGLAATSRVADVEDAAKSHALGRGELVGTYERK